MKHGKTLDELMTELERQQESRRDFVVPTSHVRVSVENNVLAVAEAAGDVTPFGITDHTHRQIGGFTGIPAKFYDRLRKDHPDLLQANVNALLDRTEARRTVRTLDGRARAFLSDRYQRIDNLDVAQQVLEAFKDSELKVQSCEVTERRMYIKAVTPRVTGELAVNDTVQAGVVVSNSEIGQGALSVEPLMYRLVCLNGMILPSVMRRSHVGRRAEENSEIYELLADDTRKADDKALLLKVRDVVKASIDQTRFDDVVEKFAAAREDRIEGDVTKVMEAVAEKVDFTEGEKTQVFNQLFQSGDLSRFGMINAVTAAAQEVESYDRSTDLERIGTQLLDLPAGQWQELAQAA